MRFLFLSLFIISTFSVKAQSLPLYEFMTNEFFSEYIIVDKESSEWVVKIYRENHGEMQDLKDQKTFDNFKDAREFKKQYVAKFKLQYPQQEISEAPVIVDSESVVVESSTVVVVDDVVGFEYITEAPETQIWVAYNQWNAHWEREYSKWVEQNLTKDFFSKYNIKTDCADVVIGLRWIFARINSLPAMNTLTGSGNYFGNMSMKKDWRGLPRAFEWHQDMVFRNALEYVMRNTYTRSLKQDSYPIAINKETMTAGAHHLEFHSEGGHAMIVNEVKVTKGLFGGTKLTTMDSTLPRKVRDLKTKKYNYGLIPQFGSGFLRMRWPVFVDGYWELTFPEDHPDYSEEQYDQDFTREYGSFAQAIKGRISGINRISNSAFRTMLTDLRKEIEFRASIVQQGSEECAVKNCAPGTEGWQEWSTPVRDHRLMGLIIGALNIAELNKRNDQLMETWDKFINRTVKLRNRKWVRISKILNIFEKQKYGSDPRMSLEMRWGLED